MIETSMVAGAANHLLATWRLSFYRLSSSLSLVIIASQRHAAPMAGTQTISTMATAISTPNATVYVANIDWKIKKPLLKRALYSLFSRHGKVGLRLWRVLPENVDLFCFIPPNNAVEFASLLRVTLFSHFG